MQTTKSERKKWFEVGWELAEYVRDISAFSRDSGERRTKDRPISHNAYTERQTAVLEIANKFHCALPLVVIELVKENVWNQVGGEADIRQPVELEPLSRQQRADYHVLSIMATGLNRFVRRSYDRELWAGPDFDAYRVEDRYTRNYCPLELSRDYHTWLKQQDLMPILTDP